MTSPAVILTVDRAAVLWQVRRPYYVGILLQPVLIVAAAMALVYTARPVLASQVLFLLILAVLGYHTIRGSYVAATAVLVGVINTIMLLRGLFLYSLPILLLLGAIALWVLYSPGTLSTLTGHREVIAVVLCGLVYWWLSTLSTGDYATNIRVLELCLTVCMILLLGARRSMLGVGLTALGVGALITGLALAPYGERLGMVIIGEVHIGNPIQLGLVTTLMIVLSVADGGRWLFLPGAHLFRRLLTAGSAICLALTTSRGSWLVAIAGLTVVLLFGRGDRTRVLAMVGVAVLAISAVIVMGAAAGTEKYFDKVFAPDRTMAERTTGRSDQWILLPAVFSESPVFGHGLGSGKYVYQRYAGRALDWHSLYLHIAVETGLIGLTCLTVLLVSLLRRTWRHYKAYGEIVPLVAIVCFMVIGVSVSGFDALSGVYLGLACLAMNKRSDRFTGALLRGDESLLQAAAGQ